MIIKLIIMGGALLVPDFYSIRDCEKCGAELYKQKQIYGYYCKVDKNTDVSALAKFKRSAK